MKSEIIIWEFSATLDSHKAIAWCLSPPQKKKAPTLRLSQIAFIFWRVHLLAALKAPLQGSLFLILFPAFFYLRVYSNCSQSCFFLFQKERYFNAILDSIMAISMPRESLKNNLWTEWRYDKEWKKTPWSTTETPLEPSFTCSLANMYP